MSDDDEPAELLDTRGLPIGGRAHNKGTTKRVRVTRRSLVWALEEAFTDEEFAEALARIAFEGEWPERRKRRGPKPADAGPVMIPPPPGEAQRALAFKMLAERRYGAPMQAVLVKAELDARSRVLDNAADAIDVNTLDASLAAGLEAVLTKALASATADDTEDE